jgi:hypothetical protein
MNCLASINSLYFERMNHTFSKIKRSIGVVILAVFVFSFLHSEVGFLNHDDDNHSSHDHCTIVNGSTTPTTKTNSSNLIKLKADFVFIPKIIEEEDQNTLVFFTLIDNPHYSNKTNKVYLQNRIFLI